MDARPPQQGDGRQGLVVGAGAADAVVGLPEAVQGELVLPAAVVPEFLAHVIGEVEGVAQDGKGKVPLLQQPGQLPELGVEDGVPAGEVEVGQAAGPAAEGLAVFDDPDHVLQGHLLELGVAAQGVDVAVLAPLVAGLGDVPLKSKVFHGIRSFVGW